MNKYDELVLDISSADVDSPMGPFADFKFVYASNGHMLMRLPIDLVELSYQTPSKDRYDRVKLLIDNTGKLSTMYHPLHIPKNELIEFINTIPLVDQYEQIKCETCNGTTICPHCGGDCPNCTSGTVDGEAKIKVRDEAFIQLAYANFYCPVLERLLKIADVIGENAIFYKYSSPNSPNLFEIGAALLVVYPHIMTPKTIDKLYKFERRPFATDEHRAGRGVDRQNPANAA